MNESNQNTPQQIPSNLYLGSEEIQRYRDQFKCIEYIRGDNLCRVNGQNPYCGGRLFDCTFFDVRTARGIVVLSTQEGGQPLVQDAFYLDECLPENPEAFLRLAKLYEFKGMLETAKGAFSYVMSLDPSNEEAKTSFERLEDLLK